MMQLLPKPFVFSVFSIAQTFHPPLFQRRIEVFFCCWLSALEREHAPLRRRNENCVKLVW
jgi:hypothetical protein